MHPEGGWGLYKVPVLPSPPPPTTQSPQQRKSGEGSPRGYNRYGVRKIAEGGGCN